MNDVDIYTYMYVHIQVAYYVYILYEYLAGIHHTVLSTQYYVELLCNTTYIVYMYKVLVRGRATARLPCMVYDVHRTRATY